MPLVFAAITPHPPILIPEVGKGEEKKLAKTTKAMQTLAQTLAKAEPDTLIFITPHTLLFPDRFNICGMEKLYGSFANFDAPEFSWQGKNDTNLAQQIADAAEEENLIAFLYHNAKESFEIDHGILVPLYFLGLNLDNPYKILPIGYSYLPRAAHFSFGQAIRRVCDQEDKRIALIASGDLSHRLFHGAPAGFSHQGKKFDQQFVELIKKNDVTTLINLDEEFVDEAGECGYRSTLILLGALSKTNYQPKILSYEGPFGVGYGVANFGLEDHDTT